MHVRHKNQIFKKIPKNPIFQIFDSFFFKILLIILYKHKKNFFFGVYFKKLCLEPKMWFFWWKIRFFGFFYYQRFQENGSKYGFLHFWGGPLLFDKEQSVKNENALSTIVSEIWIFLGGKMSVLVVFFRKKYFFWKCIAQKPKNLE